MHRLSTFAGSLFVEYLVFIYSIAGLLFGRERAFALPVFSRRMYACSISVLKVIYRTNLSYSAPNL